MCPVCPPAGGHGSPLAIASKIKSTDSAVLEGILICSDPRCQHEFPIIDGIPLLLPDPRKWVAENAAHVLTRDDLSADVETLLGDCCGHGSWYDTTRQHLSSYAWDHYGSQEPGGGEHEQGSGGVLQLLAAGLDCAGSTPGPVLDAGCSVGGTTLSLAEQTGQLVLGVDLNQPMLRCAHRVLDTGAVRFPLRRVGVVYDRREFPVRVDGSDHVDFWACDAAALPFAADTFGAVVGLNLLDCMQSPLAFLESIGRVLRPEGKSILACPYDWSANATAMESWVGGHSQRGPMQGSSAEMLRALFDPSRHPQAIAGMKIIAEKDDLPWRVRMHDRSFVDYSVHMIVAQKDAAGE